MLGLLRRAPGQIPMQSHGRDVAEIHGALEVVAAVPLMLASPAYRPGVCWHEAHVELRDGHRYGVTPHSGHITAALTRCHHSGPGGR